MLTRATTPAGGRGGGGGGGPGGPAPPRPVQRDLGLDDGERFMNHCSWGHYPNQLGVVKEKRALGSPETVRRRKRRSRWRGMRTTSRSHFWTVETLTPTRRASCACVSRARRRVMPISSQSTERPSSASG